MLEQTSDLVGKWVLWGPGNRQQCFCPNGCKTDPIRSGAGWHVHCVNASWHVSGELSVPPPSLLGVRAPDDHVLLTVWR